MPSTPDPSNAPTPPFIPLRPSPSSKDAPHPLSSPTEEWTPALLAACHFGRATFLAVLKDLCLHPERNSNLILRADRLPPLGIAPHEVPGAGAGASGVLTHARTEEVEEVRVRLMPRQPNRDGKVAQRCLFFRSCSTSRAAEGHDGAARDIGVRQHGRESEEQEDLDDDADDEAWVIYCPEVQSPADLPFYYPPVRKLAYRWRRLPEAEARAATAAAAKASRSRRRELRQAERDRARRRVELAATKRAERGLPVEVVPEEVDAQSSEEEEEAEDLDQPPIIAEISIAYLPWPASALAFVPPAPVRRVSPLAPKSAAPVAAAPAAPPSEEKLHRICVNLLERVYRCGFGMMNGYQKRVHHDVIVSREPFQDLYLRLKDRHRHLDSRKAKAGVAHTKIEDVKRHVFKDVALAAFLMLLWRDMYPAQPARSARLDASASAGTGNATASVEDDAEVQEWDTWGRPSAGFVDLGCGNGLLVHILTAEGYAGKGYELRARRTWPTYPPATRACLVEMAIDFPSWFPARTAGGALEWKGNDVIRDGCFIIGNHADEVTPWIPLLSLLTPTPSPFLSLPCCAHTLDAPFLATVFNPPAHPHAPPGHFEEGLEKGQSKYKAYLMYVGWTGMMCGWEWEKEGMRVPSTRGWGIVGRKRWTTPEEDARCREWALGQVEEVRARGAFKVREKEGKDH